MNNLNMHLEYQITQITAAGEAMITENNTDFTQAEWIPLEKVILDMNINHQEAYDELQQNNVRDIDGEWAQFMKQPGAVTTVTVLKKKSLESSIQRKYKVELLSPDGVNYVKAVLNHCKRNNQKYLDYIGGKVK